MDQKKFEEWLNTIGNWERVKPSNGPGLPRPDLHDEPSPDIKLLTLHVTTNCKVCHDTKDCQVIQRLIKQPATRSQPAHWTGFCETCKKRFDPRTGQMVESKKFVKQGLRQASPGKRLGRPSKQSEFMRECNEIAQNLKSTQPQDPMVRRAELLDRLEQLRK